MITIKTVENKDEKTRITLEVMNALPEWFSPPEDIVNKSVIHREYPFIAAFDGSKAVGFAVLKIHNEYTADVITTPKTKKSNHVIKMPKFLCEEMQEYIGMLYEVNENDRLFPITKHYLHHEMDRGAKLAGVKRIRIHDLRHSAISLLIEMGFSALAIIERLLQNGRS